MYQQLSAVGDRKRHPIRRLRAVLSFSTLTFVQLQTFCEVLFSNCLKNRLRNSLEKENPNGNFRNRKHSLMRCRHRAILFAVYLLVNISLLSICIKEPLLDGGEKSSLVAGAERGERGAFAWR